MGGGWQESNVNHRTMTAGINQRCEHAADVEGSNKEGKVVMGSGVRGRWATKRAKAARAMALAMRTACDKEGDGNSNEGKGDKGGGQGTVTRAMATIWAMGTAMRLVSDIEKKGKGSKSNGEGDFGVAGEEEDGRQVD